MKKAYLLLLLLFAVLRLQATHIVGGEFQMRRLTAGQYRITMNLYFDQNNGDPKAEDTYVNVTAFRKNSLAPVETFRLNKVSDRPVLYRNPQCVSAQVQTLIMQYQADVILNPSRYSDPGGYYLSWERCCRNNVIANIQRPADAGMAFYLEFPAIQQNGTAFTNSSPVLAPVSGDVLCTLQPYQYSFRATDADNDSLLYTLVTPLQGHSSAADPLPAPLAAPYNPVIWAPGFGDLQAIRGPQPLQIDRKTGLLTVIPDRAGLFVFAVRVEEFRNGVKIGEVRREYQWAVLNCPQNRRPDITVTAPGTNAIYQPGDTLFITSSSSQCFTARIKDRDANSTLKVSAIPVNFQGSLTTTPREVQLRSATDSAEVRICWPDCALNQPTPYRVYLVVEDSGCPKPEADTVEVTIMVNPEVNHAPVIRTDLPELSVTVNVQDTVSFLVIGTDSLDSDQVSLSAVGIGFNLASVGMQFEPASGPGRVSAPFYWKTDCNLFMRQPSYQVLFTARDNSCFALHRDSLLVTFHLVDVSNEGVSFRPPNVFTPNGDQVNDVLELGALLPPDNCTAAFNKIEIFNRWGAKVYESKDRNAGWSAAGLPEGVYFYYFTFGAKSYKGSITVIR